jgi:hypothetical protein
MNIVTAHDGNKHFTDMAARAKIMAAEHGYDLIVEETTNVKHSKAKILLRHLDQGQTIWMDSDSMICQPLSDIFDQDFDLALPVKVQLVDRTRRYGRHLHTGFIACNDTPATRQLLSAWDVMCNRPEAPASDQRNLHLVLKKHLGDFIYDNVGNVVTLDGVRVALLDPFVYCHWASIKEMKPPVPECRVLHFKGYHQLAWPEYKEMMCWS